MHSLQQIEDTLPRGPFHMLYDAKWSKNDQTKILSREDMEHVLPEWEDLCGRLAEDTPYYTPVYANALLSSIDHDRDIRFATVWRDTRMIAMLPICRTRIGAVDLPNVWQAWTTPYTLGCTPLLDRDLAGQAASALVESLKTFHRGIWIIPTINTGGKAASALFDALHQFDASISETGQFERAILRRDGTTFDEHLQEKLSGKRRRDLARNRRRLEKLGEVEHVVSTGGDGLADAVEAFLEIEKSGWKGERGTALACDPSTAEFARNAFAPIGVEDIGRADVLTLDGKPIAVSLMILTGRTGFTVKCAYDEEYRSYSAGLVLEIDVIRSFLSEDWADLLDSATAGSHIIDSLWSDRIEMADLIFTFSPVFPGWQLAAATRAMDAKQQAKSRIKKLIGRK